MSKKSKDKKSKDKIGYIVNDETKKFLDEISKTNEVLGMKIASLQSDKADGTGKLYLTFEITEVIKKWVNDKV